MEQLSDLLNMNVEESMGKREFCSLQGFVHHFSSIGHVRYVWPRRDGTGSNTPSRGRVDYLAYGGCCFGVSQPKI